MVLSSKYSDQVMFTRAMRRRVLIQWLISIGDNARRLDALDRVQEIAAARLRHPVTSPGQSGPDKQETPEVVAPRASTDRSILADRTPGGCYTKSA